MKCDIGMIIDIVYYRLQTERRCGKWQRTKEEREVQLRASS